MKKAFIIYILLMFIMPSSSVMAKNANSITDQLNFNDLVQLSNIEKPEGKLLDKLNYTLHTPLVDNSISKNPENSIQQSKKIGKYIRVASWNIERGFCVNRIEEIFNDPDAIVRSAKSQNPKEIAKLREEVETFRKSSIIVMNEVDLGMPRTGYKNVAEELAKSAGFNYAYGVEFVEVDPSHLGLKSSPWSEEASLFPTGYKVDPNKYKGLHGTAILSKFPLSNVRIIRLPQPYDWYNGEKNRISDLETIKRKAAELVFKEDMITEVRHGSRMALVADISIPGADRPLTIAAVHLENRTPPNGRRDEMKALLDNLHDVNNPVIIAGDMNTTCTDGSPTSVKKEVIKKVKDPNYIAKTAVSYIIPYALAFNVASTATSFTRKFTDPTVRSIPVVSPNPERPLFTLLKNYKFADGYMFDFRGVKDKVSGGLPKDLGDSNERSIKGFTPTFIFDRPLVIGRYKLDWFFVKAYNYRSNDSDESFKMAPHFGRTLLDLNYGLTSEISDHAPITVDLPLND